MRKHWKIVAGVAVAALAVTVVAGTALAQGPRGGTQSETGVCTGDGAMGRLGRGGDLWGHGATIDVVVELTGLSQEEIAAEREAGKSLAEIAASQGVPSEQLVDAILESRSEALAELVADGKLTQEQADAMLANMEARVSESINRTETGPANGSAFAGRGRMGGGRMGAGRGFGTCDGAGITQ